MKLRVTRPGFINGIQALAVSDAPVPHLPSMQQWREGSRSEPYDPNTDATRTEMRARAYPGEEAATLKGPEVVADRLVALLAEGFDGLHRERIG